MIVRRRADFPHPTEPTTMTILPVGMDRVRSWITGEPSAAHDMNVFWNDTNWSHETDLLGALVAPET